MRIKHSAHARRAIARRHEGTSTPGGVRAVAVGWLKGSNLAINALFIQTTGVITTGSTNEFVIILGVHVADFVVWVVRSQWTTLVVYSLLQARLELHIVDEFGHVKSEYFVVI